MAEHTTINPLSERETTSNKQRNELNHKTLISWPGTLNIGETSLQNIQ